MYSAERVHFGVQNHPNRGSEMGTTNPLRMCSDLGPSGGPPAGTLVAAILCASTRFDGRVLRPVYRGVTKGILEPDLARWLGQS